MVRLHLPALRKKKVRQMLTEYDVTRIARAIVEQLVDDERFIKKVTSSAPQRRQLVSLPAAAELLGVSKSWMYHHVGDFRKTKGSQQNSRIKFDTATLYEDYQTITNKEIKQ